MSVFKDLYNISVLSLQGLWGRGGRGECSTSHLCRTRISVKDLRVFRVRLAETRRHAVQKNRDANAEISYHAGQAALMRRLVRIQTRARVIFRCLQP